VEIRKGSNLKTELLEMNGRDNRIIRDIQAGIEAELADTPQYLDYRVASIKKEGEVWKVYVDLRDDNSRGLDESFEGATAWWAGPPKGGADVLSVIPENEQINLRFATKTNSSLSTTLP
jgi:hypothetical protein